MSNIYRISLILFFLVTSQISSYWINVWIVKCNLVSFLGLLDLVPYLCLICPCLIFQLSMSFVSWIWRLSTLFCMNLGILLSRLLMVNSVLFSYILFYCSFSFFFYFLFLEQLGLGLISHAVTSVTTWWHSHKTDHRT